MTASTDFELLFESAPISLWLEDYSALKTLFAQWRAEGITDLGSYLRQNPLSAAQCSQCYKVLQVNRQTLRLYGATNQQELVARLPDVFRGDMFEHMVTELVHLWKGELEFSSQGVNYTLDGRRMDVQIHVRVLEGHEDTWDRVMVSLQEVTEHTLARLKLEQSEQHARNLFDLSPVSLWGGRLQRREAPDGRGAAFGRQGLPRVPERARRICDPLHGADPRAGREPAHAGHVCRH